ncbi:MAG: hypothetical protein IPN47_22395 [Gemmatimonadetes bacterium]|nr:hypothetical protein [Gemmatimonadota bacterium]
MGKMPYGCAPMRTTGTAPPGITCCVKNSRVRSTTSSEKTGDIIDSIQ